nr:hypothetical protein [Pseudonocardiales bacterium]
MRVRAVPASEAALLASAVALRWSRPDLTAALAEHVGDVSTGDDRMWAAAAGWLVHGRAVVGDGRECASDALAELARRGAGLLDDPAADRLRIEVGLLAADQCEPAMARLLVAPLLGADRSADVRADAFGVLARCVMEERPAAIGEATRCAEIAWGAVDGSHAELAGAALALLSAAALRRSGQPDSAVDRAEAGLARLDGLRGGDDAPSQHLTAALGAEWITALIEAGRTDEARDGCQPMVRQLQEATRPTRQIALLRLAVARALAESTSVAAVQALEQAAQDAAGCDTPDLEGLCLSTLGALREQSGRLDAALESMRRGVAAQRRDRARSERFRAALGAMSLGSPSRRAAAVARPLDRRERMAEGNLVEPVHPLAGGGEVNPWSTGHWPDQRPMRTSGVVAFEPRVDDGDSASALTEGVSDEAAPDLDHEDTVEFYWGPAPDSGGIEDIPVGREEGLTHLAYEGERWLEGALAELDRVWGQPLPDLDRSVALPAEPAVAPTASGSNGNGHAVDDHADDQAVDGQAVDDHTVDDHTVNDLAVDDQAVDGHAVGCVVVIDVVRAGASVPDVAEVLREVSDRLTQRIPAGGRLRCEGDESALSVVLPGRTRSAATDWMQQTLPGVFADMADLGGAQRWATGTTLRAAVHDTDGPVGAQLLQRLDFVASRSPVTRAQHDVSPLAVV